MKTKLSQLTILLLMVSTIGCLTKTSNQDIPTDDPARSEERLVDPDKAREARLKSPNIEAVAVEAKVAERQVSFVESNEAQVREMVVTETPTPKKKFKPKGTGQKPLDERNLEAQPLPDKDGNSALPDPPLQTKSTGLLTDFDSTDFDDNITTTGSVFIPPDSHAAAGPDHVVNVVNTTIRFHLKDGTLVLEDSLANFFASLGPLTNTFDPKVLYDQYNRRFVVVTLEQTDTATGSPANTSRIFVAVSDDDDPSGVWFMTAINSSIVIGGLPRWADYPGFAVDRHAVYIATNMFAYFGAGGGFGGNRLFVIEKDPAAGFYAGGAANVVQFDPVPGGFLEVTQQPAHMFGRTTFLGTYLVGFSGLTDGVDEFYQVIQVEDPLTAPVLTGQFVNIGNVDNLAGGLPGAPQLGSAVTISTNDRRTLDVDWQRDNLYVTTTINPRPGDPDAGQATAFWSQMDTTVVGGAALVDGGTIGGEDIAPGTFTFFPAIAVNSAGDLSIGFSASAPSIYAGAYFTNRRVTDPPGFVEPTMTLRNGLDFYVRTFGGGSNRWGDYSGAAVDPIDQCFWIYNEYASLRGTPTGPPIEDGRWATAYGLHCPCEETYTLTPGQWKQISLPCDPRGATVDEVFGDDMGGTYGMDWFVYQWNPFTSVYEYLNLSSRLVAGRGYWILTNLAGQTVDTGLISSPVPKAAKLVGDPNFGRWNMIGHPYPLGTCWSDIRVIDGPNLLTLDQADPLIGAVRACDMNPPDPSCVMSRVMYKWNGSSYDTFDGTTPGMEGYLTDYDGLWVRSYKSSTGVQYSASEQALCGTTVVPKRANGWLARIKLAYKDFRDEGTVFGVLSDSSDGYDYHDLPKLIPEQQNDGDFGAVESSVLYAVFVQDDWGTQQGSYASDFRAPGGLQAKFWDFEVRAAAGIKEVTIALDGPADILDGSLLVDEEAGIEIKVEVGVPVEIPIEEGVRVFRWYPN